MRPKSIGNKVYLISASLRPLLALIYGRAVIYNPKILSSEIQKDGCDLKNNFITLGIPNQQTLKSLLLANMEWNGTREARETAAMHSVLFLLFRMVSSSSTELANRKTGFSTKRHPWSGAYQHPPQWQLLGSNRQVGKHPMTFSGQQPHEWMDGWMDGKRSHTRTNYKF